MTRQCHHALLGQFGVAEFRHSAVPTGVKRDMTSKLGRGSRATNKAARAIADYTKAIAIDPKDANAYDNRGVAYARKGEVDRAIADYTKAIALDPNVVRAYALRGVAYEKKGEVDRAIADYTKAIAIDPNDAPAAYTVRGVAYKKKGDKEQAIADFRKALEINPSYQEAKNRLKRLGVTP